MRSIFRLLNPEMAKASALPAARRWSSTLALAALAGALSPAAFASTIVVNSAADPAGFNPSITVEQLGTTVTFRDAVNAANNTGGDQTIMFIPGLGGATIQLSQVGNTTVSNSALGITASISILGPGPGLTLSNAVSMRHFYVASSGALSLTGLKLTGGGLAGDGGSIYNLGHLATTNVTFRYNQANFTSHNATTQGRGGVIFNTSPGTYAASLTTFSVNTAQGMGGAIYNDNPAAGAVLVSGSAFLNDYSTGAALGANNYNSGGSGGAIYNNGAMTVALTELGGCTGNNTGGAVYNDASGVLAFTNCLFYGNYCVGTTPYIGGAAYSAGTLQVDACTFQGNSASAITGRGGAIGAAGATSKTVIHNSTFTGNSATYGTCVQANAGSMAMVFCTCDGNPPGSPYQNVLTLAAEGGVAFNVTNSVVWDTAVYNETYGSVNYYHCLVNRYANGLPDPTTGGLNFLDGGPGLPLDSGFSVGSIALYGGSAAINAGVPIPGLTTDARGVARDAWPDLGAYEYQAPQFTSAGGTTFAAGLRNSFLFTAGGTPPITYSVSGSLPAGVSFSSNGLLSGVPAAGTIGSYPITVTASNSFSPVSTANFTLSVEDGSGLAAHPVFGTSGEDWALNGDSINGGPTIINNVFTPSDGIGGETRSAWFQYPLYIGAFQAAFTYQDVTGNGADGVAFVIQNSPSGTSALGGGGGALGYTGISPSVALMLNLYSGAPGGASGWLVATNGAGNGAGYSSAVYQSTAPVNLDSGDAVNVSLAYSNGQLQITLLDPVTSAVFRTNVAINLPALVGTNTAWVGFTGGDGGVASRQAVSNFSYFPIPSLSLSGSQAVTLAWPASAYGFQLQSTTNLAGGIWADVPASPLQTNNLDQVTLAPSGAAQFFRLKL